MTSGIRFMNTYLNSSGVKVILAQSCRCSMMSKTSPVWSMSIHDRGEYGSRKVTVEIDFSLKIRVVEDLHGNFFFSMIECLEFVVLDGDVLFDILAWQDDLLVPAFPIHGRGRPVGDCNRHAKDNDKEDIGLESAAVDDRKDAFDNERHTEDEDSEVRIGKVAISLCETHEGRIFDGGRVGDAHGRERHGERDDDDGNERDCVLFLSA